ARSLGAPLRSGDLEMIRGVCREILSLYDLRRRVSDYLASITQEVAPNTVEVAGPLLTAKLIAKAGGLTKLAMMSSSKIQVLGAEKAMFRAIRTGSRPPKHGLIFQHPLIHSAPRRHRGKIARVLAGKLAMAARADAFSGRFIGDKLRGDLEERIQEIGVSKSK
ncbi:C/D box methylation guide ribonucleoprotein complex aNOP56 subunit, partial [Candidatus Bathyarchaeota archaeon]|nr:C/D box methylation guide ribonucleoprotein complex aNOP56 subunit [Candidatus Bathyarchaeota archaeon]